MKLFQTAATNAKMSTLSEDSGKGSSNNLTLKYSVSSVSARTQRAATTISLPLHMKFKEKSMTNLGPPIQDVDSMVNIRVVVILTFLLCILLVMIGGGFMFLLIESDAPKTVPVSWADCFKKAQKKAESANFSANDAIDEIKQCVMTETSLDSPGEAFLYAWSLFSTVGYGDRYPHTAWGQFMTLLFAWFSIPLFMAFKIEMGEIIALSLLKMGRGIFRVFQMFYKLVRKRNIHAEEPGDGLLSLLLTGVFAIVLCITATIFMSIDDIDWWSAFYSSGVTVTLIGLGDYVPGNNWVILVVLLPLFLFGDVLASYLFYYMHGLMRIRVHQFGEWCTTRNTKIEPIDNVTPLQVDPVVAVSATRRTSVFPSVTTTSMPFSRQMSIHPADTLEAPPMGTLSVRRKSPHP